MKRIWAFGIALVVMLASAAFLFYTYEPGDLKVHHPRFLVAVPPLVVAHLWVTGRMNHETVRPLGVRLQGREEMSLAVLTRLGNFTIPLKGGMGFRGFYLRKRHALPYGRYIASLAAGGLVSVMAAVSVGLVAFGAWIVFRGGLDWKLATGLVLALLGLLAAIIGGPFMLDRLETSPRVGRFLQRWKKLHSALDGWRMSHRDRRFITSLFALGAAQVLLQALILQLVFRAFAVPLPLDAAVLLASVGLVAVLVSVTPGGLGAQEVVTAVVGSAIGFNPGMVFSASLVGRGISLGVLLILAPFSSYYLVNRQGPGDVQADADP